MQTSTQNTVINGSNASSHKATLRDYVYNSIQSYILQLGEHLPNNLYEMVIGEVEAPLIEVVLKYTQGNQSQAAALLGLNRGTLRKKLKQYQLQVD